MSSTLLPSISCILLGNTHTTCRKQGRGLHVIQSSLQLQEANTKVETHEDSNKEPDTQGEREMERKRERERGERERKRERERERDTHLETGCLSLGLAAKSPQSSSFALSFFSFFSFFFSAPPPPPAAGDPGSSILISAKGSSRPEEREGDNTRTGKNISGMRERARETERERDTGRQTDRQTHTHAWF